MKPFLNALNIIISTPEVGKKLEYYIIPNPDGSPRWLIPSHAKNPHYLKFYHVEGMRSTLFALLTKVIFLFRLQGWIYNKEEVFVDVTPNQIIADLNLLEDQWALFTGTPGPNNKMVLYAEHSGESTFYKIPVGDGAHEIVQREYKGTKKVEAIQPASFQIPQLNLLESNILQVEDIASKGLRSNTISDLHKKMLTEIAQKTAKKTNTGESECFINGLESLKKASDIADPRIPASFRKRLGQLAEELKNTTMVTTLSHGDFTPWNMFLKEDKLAVYDWELAHDAYPLGFDAIHFIIQKGVLIERKSWTEIRKEINESTEQWGKQLAETFQTNWELYLKLYLFINISTYLELYSRQEKWHEQINWLLETWSEALSDMLANNENARAYLIDDLFVALNNVAYATIKFPEIEPSTLDAYADIDMCMRKKDAQRLIQHIKKHPLVNAVLMRETSYMASIQIILQNKDVLNLDLIWQLKWKQLQMMSIETVLERTQVNRFGIKQLHPFDLVQYLGLFYGLNNALIPSKYSHHLEAETELRGYLNTVISVSAFKNEIPKDVLLEELKEMRSNTGINYLTNTMRYFMDTLKSLFKPKGMIITFSGVDGAGKSTVIEHVRKEFDKKLRRKVIVLRHRPSVLPILSAWTKGKDKAEQDAASNLPRQGTNQSRLSSLFRFLYYYTDYLAGQFIVYFRHVLRGDVVLYDRYYFDFINDSVRSNIRLPEKFLRMGYFFLLKPDFNFFLYADADTILSRKQELSKETITELTSKYLTLFTSLDSSKHSNGKYIPIENKDLEFTISQIMHTTSGKAA